ncbi:uncharacterized protein LOC109726003 isoform X1 [Ananas comosus]|uniref:Uncharacterized protein LOC109726003 isoform X1 n=1 Tax=Ananas comosus TaxID=4615 RepID=A0A6P5GSX3_ANACO|nr:uncharacterized protein LOC109726003 isoform X1 [Ananas comosus]
MGSVPAIAHRRIPPLISGWKRTNLTSFPLLLALPFRRNPRPRLGLAVFAGGNAGGGDQLKGDRRGEPPPPPPPQQQQFELRWRDLLNPDPENIVAVGLAGLLTWASVQIIAEMVKVQVHWSSKDFKLLKLPNIASDVAFEKVLDRLNVDMKII